MNVLFVCTGNTCRSPMAEAIFLAKGGPLHHARSAGIAANDGSPASLHAAELCAMVGKANHYARQLRAADLEWADMIFTMTDTHKQMIKQIYNRQEGIFTLKEFAGDADWDVADPYGQSRQIYERTFREIEEAVDRLIKKIK